MKTNSNKSDSISKNTKLMSQRSSNSKQSVIFENSQKKPVNSKMYINRDFNYPNEEGKNDGKFPNIVDYSKDDTKERNYLLDKIKELEEKLKEKEYLIEKTSNSSKLIREQNSNFTQKIISLEKKLNEKEKMINNLITTNKQVLDENNKLKQSKEKKHSSSNNRTNSYNLDHYANDDIQKQIEELVLMESKRTATNQIQQSYFDGNIIDPMKEYEDFILNEICPNPDIMTYEQMLELGEKVGTVDNGLDKKMIEKIKKIVFTKRLSANHKIPEKCTICQFDYEEGEVMRQLRCGHCFHTECVDGWLLKDRKCPLCKYDNKYN